MLGACHDRLSPLMEREAADGAIPDDTRVDGNTSPQSWGAYAAGLAVGLCIGEIMLEVDDTSFDLDGGDTLADGANAGPTLSLREALTIAANHTERVAIRFSREVFPAEDPATISIPPGCRVPWLENTCIDGRHRGVIIDFEGAAPGADPLCTFELKHDSLMVGLELRALQHEVRVMEGAQLAGCRVNHDGWSITPAHPIESVVATGSTIGPGNSFGGQTGVHMHESRMPRIHGNLFGVDPITHTKIPLTTGVRLGSLSPPTEPLVIVDNTFASATGIDVWVGTGESSVVIVSRNEFTGQLGVRADAMLQPLRGRLQIGPHNVFATEVQALELNAADATIERAGARANHYKRHLHRRGGHLHHEWADRTHDSRASWRVQLFGVCALP
ncbi:MAG: hypothetical protein JRH20_32610 [Deltaproteobacteria bacterium]|nr:hypothetical protein [Deltaproteobacteria bacterium]